MVKSLEGGSIDIGIVLRDIRSGEQRETDVRFVKERHVTVYECKGYQPTAVVRVAEVEE